MQHGIGDIRRKNVLTVMDALMGDRPLTRRQVAELCGLSLTTVGKITDELLDFGVLSQQPSHAGDCGRTPTQLSYIDTAVFVQFHMTAQERIMVAVDLRMRVLTSVRREKHIGYDPGEDMRLFLLDCRQALAGWADSVLLCGLLGGRESDERYIREILGCEIAVSERAADAVMRAALWEGWATPSNCTLILTDGETDGLVMCRGAVRRSELSPLGIHSLVGDGLSVAVQALCPLLSPDVLVLCADRPSDTWRAQVSDTIRKRYGVRTEVRDTVAYRALGLGLAMREAWLTRITEEDKRLRQRIGVQ